MKPNLILEEEEEDFAAVDDHEGTVLLNALPQDDEAGDRKIGFLMTCLLFFKSNFGVGLLGVPFAFKQAGLLAGIFGTILVSVFVTISTVFIIDCQRHLREQGCKIKTLSDISAAIWGGWARVVVDILVLLCQLGSCIAYCIFISTSISAILHPGTLDPTQEYGTYSIVLIALLPVLLGLTLLRRMDNVKFLSIFAEFVHAICCIGILVYGFTHKTKCYKDDPKETIGCPVELVRFTTMPIFFGIVTFALEGIATILPIERSMTDPGQFRSMLFSTSFVLTLCFVLFGALGYTAFGEETSGVIAVNVQGGTGVVFKILLCFVLLFSYPMQFIPIADIVEQYASQTSKGELVHRFVKPVVVATTTLVAWGFPHFGYIISIIGSVGFSSLGFVLPCLALLKTVPEMASIFHVKIFCGVCVVFGAFVAVAGVAANISAA